MDTATSETTNSQEIAAAWYEKIAGRPCSGDFWTSHVDKFGQFREATTGWDQLDDRNWLRIDFERGVVVADVYRS